MVSVYPTITATDLDDYNKQIDNVKDFAEGLHIDLMDGQLAPTRSPELDKVWWPDDLLVDIHLMYLEPMAHLYHLVQMKPSTVIIHFEARLEVGQFVSALKDAGIKRGLALLQNTSVESAAEVIPLFDQVLIFSGNLGYHGGEADLDLIKKVRAVKEIKEDIEIAWDGGINPQNAPVLAQGGVSTLNVGGYIQNSPNPKDAYDKIKLSLS